MYKAEDIKLKRTVALKFFPSSFSFDEEAKKRFIHEVQSASALDHPNICTIYEINETKDGQLFISMPFYEGETLKERMLKQSLEINEAINIILLICEGLAKANEKRIYMSIVNCSFFQPKADLPVAKLFITHVTSVSSFVTSMVGMPPFIYELWYEQIKQINNGGLK